MPLYVFNGHRKAVSYVKFLSSNELASASTDSTLRLWDVKENCLVRATNHYYKYMLNSGIGVCIVYWCARTIREADTVHSGRVRCSNLWDYI